MSKKNILPIILLFAAFFMFNPINVNAAYEEKIHTQAYEKYFLDADLDENDPYYTHWYVKRCEYEGVANNEKVNVYYRRGGYLTHGFKDEINSDPVNWDDYSVVLYNETTGDTLIGDTIEINAKVDIGTSSIYIADDLVEYAACPEGMSYSGNRITNFSAEKSYDYELVNVSHVYGPAQTASGSLSNVQTPALKMPIDLIISTKNEYSSLENQGRIMRSLTAHDGKEHFYAGVGGSYEFAKAGQFGFQTISNYVDFLTGNLPDDIYIVIDEYEVDPGFLGLGYVWNGLSDWTNGYNYADIMWFVDSNTIAEVFGLSVAQNSDGDLDVRVIGDREDNDEDYFPDWGRTPSLEGLYVMPLNQLSTNQCMAIFFDSGIKEQYQGYIKEVESINGELGAINASFGSSNLSSAEATEVIADYRKIEERLETLQNTIHEYERDVLTGACADEITSFFISVENQQLQDVLGETSEIQNEISGKIAGFSQSNNLTETQLVELLEISKTIDSLLSELSDRFTNGFGLPGEVFIVNCDNLFGENTLLGQVLRELLLWIRVLAPIALIIFGCMDFAQVIFSGDQEAMKKSLSKFVKRCIAAIALFFIPLFLEILLNSGLFVDSESCTTVGEQVITKSE